MNVVLKYSCAAVAFVILTHNVNAQVLVEDVVTSAGSVDDNIFQAGMAPEINELKSHTDHQYLQSEEANQVASATNSNLEKAYVLLVPSGEIRSSYNKVPDFSVIQDIRNAINSAQLFLKGEDAYMPITTTQTTERIQAYLAQVVSQQLVDCNIASDIDVASEAFSTNEVKTLPDKHDYVYRIDLGVNLLLISKSLLTSKLIGEAQATITENDYLTKKLVVNTYSFADKGLLLEHQASDVPEKFSELKAVSNRVVNRLAERLGQKLCQFFN